jgi:hypothetical protein
MSFINKIKRHANKQEISTYNKEENQLKTIQNWQRYYKSQIKNYKSYYNYHMIPTFEMLNGDKKGMIKIKIIPIGLKTQCLK